MSDDFGDFGSEQQPAQTFDEDQPMALPPPTEDVAGESSPAAAQQGGEEDTFGLSSPAAAASSPAADGATDDPFATVDGGSQANAGAYDSFSGSAQVEVKEEEAEALKAWEKERAQVLRERATKAEADKAAALTGARDEVTKFYADRDATVQKQQKTNRADEKNYRADMKTTFESGQRWEKVNKLISTQPKPQEKAGTTRVDRMRKLLLQLKTEKKQ